MPMFDFSCTDCGLDFEDLVPSGALAACPSCGSAKTRKKPSGPAVRGGRAAKSSPSVAPGGG
ncbi:MAG TPA: zinc ribbon domain-containing protein [Thermoanaerobaculia bacterium]|nr:zinc ribbon domain-containing protein [Thermoanaerobaculia bacterium]